MIMKQTFFILLTLLLMPVVANADVVEIDGIYYNLVTNGKIAEVTSRPNGYSGEVIIPDSVEYEGVGHKVTSIGEKAFYGCYSLTSVTIPGSVTSIGLAAFQDCEGLSSITIPNSVTTIGNNGFLGCSGLTSLTLSSSLTSLENYVFKDCESLTAVTIPGSVKKIGSGTFRGCKALSSVNIGSGVTSIGDYAFFDCRTLVSVAIPNNVTTIDNNAFKKCSALSAVTFGNSLKTIGNNAFEECATLTTITIPNSATSIGNSAFEACSSLITVNIGNGVKKIGSSAFAGCTHLKNVIIGSGVTSLAAKAFAYCGELTDFYCYALTVPETNSSTFTDSHIEYATLHVPLSSLDFYKAKSPWSQFGKIMATDGEMQQCSMPTIAYVKGELQFACATEDVQFVCTVKNLAAEYFYYESTAGLPETTTSITVYATKTGYEDSDVATATIRWRNGRPVFEGFSSVTLEATENAGDVNGDGEVGIGDIVAITNIMAGK